jgi:UTP--glucose-1-phosphate uridylyltransferase
MRHRAWPVVEDNERLDALRRVGATDAWVRTAHGARTDEVFHLPLGVDRRAAEELGRGLIARRAIAAIIPAGGVATRLGGTVKAAVAVAGRSLLHRKLDRLRQSGSAPPIAVMVSEHTESSVVDLLRTYDRDLEWVIFRQAICRREILAGDATRIPPFAPTGHGDVPGALIASGVHERLLDSGAGHYFISNLDNLGPVLDPVCVGVHLLTGAQVSVEVVPRHHGDVGGGVFSRNGRIRIVEDGFFSGTTPLLNTNTFLVNAAAVPSAHLPLHAVEKEFLGVKFLQFERFLSDFTAVCAASGVMVPRESSHGRFSPIKTQVDLDRASKVLQ